jgi:hypothetical protein
MFTIIPPESGEDISHANVFIDFQIKWNWDERRYREMKEKGGKRRRGDKPHI